MLHIRVDDEMKACVSETLVAMGMSMAEAVRLFLGRVVAAQEFPPELKPIARRLRR
jgi:DNA-damage-inducible protein J